MNRGGLDILASRLLQVRTSPYSCRSKSAVCLSVLIGGKVAFVVLESAQRDFAPCHKIARWRKGVKTCVAAEFLFGTYKGSRLTRLSLDSLLCHKWCVARCEWLDDRIALCAPRHPGILKWRESIFYGPPAEGLRHIVLKNGEFESHWARQIKKPRHRRGLS